MAHHYTGLEVVGQGTYGVVYKATSKIDGREVAIKTIKMDKRAHAGVSASAIDEIRMLQELHHPNIVTLYEVFAQDEGTLSLVFDYLPTDLEMMINARDPGKEPYVALPSGDTKAYLKMLLSGVRACHENYMVHRDLKPGNLLIGTDGVLKICDFGLARTYGSPEAKYSPQAITIWYRPMELLLGAELYGPAADMCDLDQVQKIVQCMGAPNETKWPGYTHLKKKFTFRQDVQATPLIKVIPAANKNAIDLLEKLLSYDPNIRLTAAEALEHPYITEEPKATPLQDIAERVHEYTEKRAAQKALKKASQPEVKVEVKVEVEVVKVEVKVEEEGDGAPGDVENGAVSGAGGGAGKRKASEAGIDGSAR
ncbi:putative mitogen-activated protein kinase ERK-A [Baffinella frigidus]|nr:putative mitogen-activated protein kinase ERK-A [Cryptophyta sp. CCMP2293]